MSVELHWLGWRLYAVRLALISAGADDELEDLDAVRAALKPYLQDEKKPKGEMLTAQYDITLDLSPAQWDDFEAALTRAVHRLGGAVWRARAGVPGYDPQNLEVRRNQVSEALADIRAARGQLSAQYAAASAEWAAGGEDKLWDSTVGDGVEGS